MRLPCIVVGFYSIYLISLYLLLCYPKQKPHESG
jgi:hypothetical protein